MKIIELEVGEMATNCYILSCGITLDAAIIDPGAEAERILAAVKKNNLKARYIILTHGHGDHIGALSKVREATGAKVLIHAADAGMLTDKEKNLSVYIGPGFVTGSADQVLNDGDEIPVGHFTLQVLHTPGHTTGGICLLTGNTLISGDTLFAQSIGRTDFPGGSYKEIVHSIKSKLFVLPEETKVYPGHGPMTSIGLEKRTNPFT